MPSARAQDLVPKWSAILDVQDPDGTRTRHPFRHPRVRVGRRRGNDLSLADDAVSHDHCEFVSEEGYFVVRDLGSHNGTWVNDRRVGEAKLRDGDEVRIGGTRIRVSLEGKVRKPDRRSRLRILAPLLGLAAAGAIWFALAKEQQRVRAVYLSAIRHELLGPEPCVTPQFEGLDAADAQIAGRSFALTQEKGKLRLTKADEALDRELQGLYQRKLGLYAGASQALAAAQQARRDAAEKLSRAGQKLWTSRERKAAAFVDGLVQERIAAVDELAHAVSELAQDTDVLTRALGELVTPSPDRGVVDALQRFRFRADLRSSRAACEQKAETAATGLAGALTALSE